MEKEISGDQRREKLMQILKENRKPVSGGHLAEIFHVSRQVIVQDIALIRAAGNEIESTARGYVLRKPEAVTRVFKTVHSDQDTREELTLIVDLGGTVEDVFVYHKVYGVMRGRLNIRSRRDVDRYMKEIESGKSRLLKNTTSGYHYHTVSAESEEILDDIQKALKERGFLAKLQDYEPVDFWEEKGNTLP